MAGCFGNHPVDRYLENQLYRHLDETDVHCPDCRGDNLEEDDQGEFRCYDCKPLYVHNCTSTDQCVAEYDDFVRFEVLPSGKRVERFWCYHCGSTVQIVADETKRVKDITEDI